MAAPTANSYPARTSDPADAKVEAQRRAVPFLLLLNVATGAVEVVCFGHLGQVFTAYVTGTVILAGLSLGTGGFSQLAPYGAALAGFACGAALGGRLLRGLSAPRRVFARLLSTEAGFLVAASVVLGMLPAGPGTTGRYLTLGLCGVAMAVQFSAMRHLNVPDLTLAVATGTIHGLMHDGPAGRRQPQRHGRRLAAVAAIAVGAAGGAALTTWHPWVALLLAVGLVTSAGAGSWLQLSDQDILG